MNTKPIITKNERDFILRQPMDIIYIAENIPVEKYDIIPSYPGIYIYQIVSGKRYVGNSENIRNRMREHMSKCEWLGVSIKRINIYVTNTKPIRDAEINIIGRLKPELNVRFINIEELRRHNRRNIRSPKNKDILPKVCPNPSCHSTHWNDKGENTDK